MALRLKGQTSGSVQLDVPAAVSGGDVSLTLPNGTGSANQFLKNGSAAGTLEYSSIVEDGSGNITATGTAEFGGVLSVNRTNSGDGCFHAKLNGTTKASIASDGSATFTGAVTSTTTAKAWVNFNGTGTVAIRASHNVGSITDNGTGSYTVNFTTAMTDANYVCVVNASNEDDVSNLNPPAGVDRLA